MVRCSVEVAGHFRYLDHHQYSPEDCRPVNEFCKAQKITDIVMTQKDAVKLKKLVSCFDAEINLFVIEVQIEVTKGEEVFLTYRFSIVLFLDSLICDTQFMQVFSWEIVVFL
jgi:tetraacyldisaccharide-1-P 4'-kinase